MTLLAVVGFSYRALLSEAPLNEHNKYYCMTVSVNFWHLFWFRVCFCPLAVFKEKEFIRLETTLKFQECFRPLQQSVTLEKYFQF